MEKSQLCVAPVEMESNPGGVVSGGASALLQGYARRRLAVKPVGWLKEGDGLRVEVDRLGAIESVMHPEAL
jgi:hypothetical protein